MRKLAKATATLSRKNEPFCSPCRFSRCKISMALLKVGSSITGNACKSAAKHGRASSRTSSKAAIDRSSNRTALTEMAKCPCPCADRFDRSPNESCHLAR